MVRLSFPVIAPRYQQASAASKALRNEQRKDFIRDLWLVLASIIAFLTLVRIIRLFLSSLPRYKPTDKRSISEKAASEGVNPGQSGKASWRRIPAAIASAFRIVAFRMSITIGPGMVASVTELSFICGYIAVMFILLLVDTEGFDTYYYEDRAAHLASCQLPLIVALAGKNNIISFMTGVGHEKLNVLHRASARTCLIFLWIHTIARFQSSLPDGLDLASGWMRCGITGLAAFTLATIISVRPVRNAFFEFFLISHIVLVAVFLICGYFHTRHAHLGAYIWPALVVWAFDRVLRLVRLVWNNSGGNDKIHSTAAVELLSSDTIRLTLRRKFNWKPGQHAYVILPTVSGLPTEAHPFTIASIPRSLPGNNNSEDQDVVFLIRGRSGFTARLRDHARNNVSSTVPALIDGPYGCPPDLKEYHTCVLIAGGSGVSYTLPLFQSIVCNAGMSAVRRIVFVWAVRDAEHLKWISKLLTEALIVAKSSKLAVEPLLYITGPNCPIPEVSDMAYAESSGDTTPSPIDESDKDGNMSLPLYSALRIKHGRPSLRRILQEEIYASPGPVSVDVAGPSALSQAVRHVLSSDITNPMAVLKGTLPSVTLHVESFGMTH